MIKKIITIITIVSILTTQVFANGIVGLPIVSDTGASVQCNFNSQEEFYPVGDTSGKSIFTKRDVIRDCNVTKEVQGACLRWREDRVIGSVPTEAYSSFDSRDYSDTIGSFFATVGAYDQMEHLWSGFEGYCVSGTLRDFNWVGDPMFWASLAMGYFMSGGKAGAVSKSFNNGVNTVGKAAITEGASNAAAAAAVDSFSDEVINSSGTELWSASASEAAAYGVNKAVNELGKCLVSASFSLGAATAAFLTAGSGEVNQDCNPIDEICGDENKDNGESEIQTMDIQTFVDLSNGFTENGDNIYDFIEVIDDGSQTGVVSYIYISTDQMGIENMDMQAANELMEKVRNAQMIFSMGVAAAGLAACMSSGAAYGSGTSNATTTKDPDRAKIQSGLNMGIDYAAKLVPPPAGPVIAVVAKLVVALAMSYSKIDSCNSKEDAQKMGSRHEKTEKSLRFNLCRPMWDSCEDDFFWGSCALQGYHYCCYDQLLTKVLVTQIKAELGREWTDCTGISIRDLNYVSFEQCTPAEMADGIDGAHAYGVSVNPRISSNGTGIPDYEGPVWNPEDAFQYKHKCMDLTEFRDFLQAQIGEDIDPDSFKDFWNGLTKKQPI